MEAAITRFEYPTSEVTGKIVEATQRRGLRDVEVVSDEDPRLPSARQKISKV